MIENLNDFFENQLGSDWKWRGKTEEGFFSFSNGRLCLNAIALKDNSIKDMPNILTKEIENPVVNIKAKIKLKLKEDKDMVGLSIFNNKIYCIIAEKCGDEVYIKQSNYDGAEKSISDEIVVYKAKIRNDIDIYFEIRINEDRRITYYFGYSADDIYKMSFSDEYDKACKLEAGIFCVNADGKLSEGCGKFEYVRFY